VLAFIKVIASSLTELGIFIGIGYFNLVKMRSLDGQKRGYINQLLKLIREKLTTTTILTDVDNIPFLPNMDNKTRQIVLGLNADTDIPLLMDWLATPRTDGKQRVIQLGIESDQLAMEMMDALKQVVNFIL
jgi:hypothetical protein